MVSEYSDIVVMMCYSFLLLLRFQTNRVDKGKTRKKISNLVVEPLRGEGGLNPQNHYA